MRAIGYVRVSTSSQDEQNQIKAIREYCKQNKIELIEIFKDRGVSGLKKFVDREGGKKLVEFTEKNKIDVVIVTALDRIARDSLDIKNTIEYFKKKGIKLISLSKEEFWINYLFDDKADDIHRLIASILLEILTFFANFELKKRKERQELAWEAGKQKGRPPKVSDEEILQYVKKYRPQGLSWKNIWAIMRADLERKHRETISYEAFIRRVIRLKKKGVIREVIN